MPECALNKQNSEYASRPKYAKILNMAGFLICDALRDLVPFVQFKNVKNTPGGVLILVKLQLQLYQN